MPVLRNNLPLALKNQRMDVVRPLTHLQWCFYPLNKNFFTMNNNSALETLAAFAIAFAAGAAATAALSVYSKFINRASPYIK
jgi:hypothetical protein